MVGGCDVMCLTTLFAALIEKQVSDKPISTLTIPEEGEAKEKGCWC